MTLNEALSEGLQVTFVGLVIVFSVLIILMITMMIMKKVFYKEDKPKEDALPVVKAPEVKQTQLQAAASDDAEIIAVLAAAVAACLGTSPSNLKISSYRRIGNNSPDWNRAGLRENIESRF